MRSSRGLTVKVDGISVKTDAKIEKCPACGEDFVNSRELGAAEQAAAIEVLTNMKQSCSGAAIRFARKSLGLRQEDLAQLLDVRTETVSRWEQQPKVDRVSRLAVAALVRLYPNEPVRLAI
jgi:putative zinc finger/helix-turn-helix YgiT family protein